MNNIFNPFDWLNAFQQPKQVQTDTPDDEVDLPEDFDNQEIEQDSDEMAE
jgi:hypothetical protein